MTTAITDRSIVWKNRLLLLGAVSAFVGGVVAYHGLGGGKSLAGLGLLAVGVLAALILSLLSPAGQQFLAFSREAIQEVKRVHWPSRKETTQTTLIVFVFVFVMALFLWLTDKSLEWFLYDLLLGWKR